MSERAESASLFCRSLPQQDGIYRDALPRQVYPLAQASNFLPLTAKLYEPLWRHRSLSILTAGSYSTARELETMLQWLEPQAGMRILDVGCSAALYARTILERQPAAVLHALDMSLPFLHHAQRLMQQPFTLVQGSVYHLPYGDASFDALVCGGSLNEFRQWSRALHEMARVLRLGGYLWLMYLKRGDSWLAKRRQDIMELSGIIFPEHHHLLQQCQDYGLSAQRAEIRADVVLVGFEKQRIA